MTFVHMWQYIVLIVNGLQGGNILFYLGVSNGGGWGKMDGLWTKEDGMIYLTP